MPCNRQMYKFRGFKSESLQKLEYVLTFFKQIQVFFVIKMLSPKRKFFLQSIIKIKAGRQGSTKNYMDIFN